MKPKTKVHFDVLDAVKKLPRITSVHKEWAYAKLFSFYGWHTKHKAACFECGHEWSRDSGLDNICPKCGKKLVISKSRAWSVEEYNYFQIITTCCGFQVIRMFHIWHYGKKGYPAHYSCHEVYQQWISPKGKLVIMGIKSSPMGGWRTGDTAWCWGTPMEIRGFNDRYFRNKVTTYPGSRFIPEIRRNGFKNNAVGFNMGYFFSLLLSYPIFETLIKTNQMALVKRFDYSRKEIKKYWPQIKICIRHGYMIKDASMWLDHIEELEQFGKDIHNPKFICPKNLAAMHQMYIDKRNEIRRKEERSKLVAKINEANIMYKQDKAKYLGLAITDGELTVVILDNVNEFFLEGEAMHHCVFNSQYYRKEDSLIMSARIGSKRLETIELSLSDYKILQCRGRFCKNTPYHKRIINMVNKNIDLIKKAGRKKRLKQVA